MSQHSTSALVIIALVSLGGGLTLGFFGGVASTHAGGEFLQDMFEDEQKAATTSPQTLLRPKFEVKYPSNWKIDTSDPDDHLDHFFSIESPGNAFCMFILGQSQFDENEALQLQIQQFAKLMPNPESSVPFDRFGSLTGKGLNLTGRAMGITTQLKLFTHSGKNGTLTIVQQVSQEDSKLTADGFKLIEDSFRFRPASETPDTP